MSVTRRFWVLLHRYVGLFILLFVFQAGFTGAFLAFYEELDHLALGSWSHVEARGEMLPLGELVARAQAQLPDAVITGGSGDYTARPMESLKLWAEARSEERPIDFDEVFVDPYTGQVLGTRLWGEIAWGWEHVMPLVYKLHYELLLGEWGYWFMGIIVTLWALDHFVALYVSWPRSGPFWRALTIKVRGSLYRLNFDFHRAGGLFVWVILLTIAITGASWNATFWETNIVRAPLVAIWGEQGYPIDKLPERESPLTEPPVGPDVALATFKQELAAAGYADDARHIGIWYDSAKGAYGGYAAVNSFETAWFEAAIDGETGEVKALRDPKDDTVADVVNGWMFPLHSGQAFGLVGRILICASGVVLCVLCVTGFVIWLRKRRAERVSRLARASRGRLAEAPAE